MTDRAPTLHVRDLPPAPEGRHLPGGGYVEPERPTLICSQGCDGEYSAHPGDYWAANQDTELTCDQCGAPMQVVRKVTTFEPWGGR